MRISEIPDITPNLGDGEQNNVAKSRFLGRNSPYWGEIRGNITFCDEYIKRQCREFKEKKGSFGHYAARLAGAPMEVPDIEHCNLVR